MMRGVHCHTSMSISEPRTVLREVSHVCGGIPRLSSTWFASPMVGS